MGIYAIALLPREEHWDVAYMRRASKALTLKSRFSVILRAVPERAKTDYVYKKREWLSAAEPITEI